MKPYYDRGGVELYLGDALECLRELPDESVNCCITSPPYWGLRDYGTAEWEGGDAACGHQPRRGHGNEKQSTSIGTSRDKIGGDCKCGARRIDKQLGLEQTPDEYVARLVGVFAEVRRVLRDDGTLWLNLGDSYASQGGKEPPQTKWNKEGIHDGQNAGKSRQPPSGLKPKDLVGIPWMLAFALRADGWWLRSDIIWAKRAPMPESVTDRPTRSHEYIFLLAKSERYWYDSEAIKEPATSGDPRKPYAPGQVDARGNGHARNGGKVRPSVARGGFNGKTEALAAGGRNAFRAIEDWRNKRDVWTVNTDPFPEAHFATFPPALILPCVLAGCPAGGMVLDPFSGAGTTALVAKKNGRKCIGIELNEDYLEMSAKRLSQEVLDFQETVTA